MDDSEIRFELDPNGVALATLDRPPVRIAFTGRMGQELSHADHRGRDGLSGAASAQLKRLGFSRLAEHAASRRLRA